ncbi:MAG: glycine--tRNA ligase [Nanoarchaeota archaeon]
MISIDEMATFCKKKGIAFPSAELYGGLSGFYDFGPIGVELKNNIKAALWRSFVQQREDVLGIDGAIITHPKVWQASGHTANFADAMVSCEKCKEVYRADTLIEDSLKLSADGMAPDQMAALLKDVSCPKCKGHLAMGNSFNLMFSTSVGPDKGLTAYLRPETAQLIFTAFPTVVDVGRVKLPFGIAQEGKAFRNEISPRDFLFRTREFEQFEIEFFCHPKKLQDCLPFDEIKELKVHLLAADKTEHSLAIGDLLEKRIFKTAWHAYWVGLFYRWFLDHGIKASHLRIREHHKEELAHYASACFDIEYKFPFGWKEIHGDADRSSFDLEQHAKAAKKELGIFDEESKEKVVPHVAAEPSQGIERALLAFLFDAYDFDKERGNVVLHLHPSIAPVKVAVFPLVSNKPELMEAARSVFEALRKHMPCIFDKSGSIGRRYARQDETGTPFCVTVDFDSLTDGTVTVRDRDSTKQERIKKDDLLAHLLKNI